MDTVIELRPVGAMLSVTTHCPCGQRSVILDLEDLFVGQCDALHAHQQHFGCLCFNDLFASFGYHQRMLGVAERYLEDREQKLAQTDAIWKHTISHSIATVIRPSSSPDGLDVYRPAHVDQSLRPGKRWA